MLISYIVPAFNARDTIEECVKSILNQRGKKEVIIVDNGSDDSTVKILKEIRGIKLLIEKKRGASSARNTGLKASRGEFIAFIDSDVMLPDKWAEKALKLIKKENIAGVGGPGISTDNNAVSRSLNILLFGKGINTKNNYVESLATMNVLYNRECIDGIFFDENITYPAGDDQEFNFRVIKKGYKLLFSKSLYVYHHHPISLKSLIVKWYNYGRYFMLPYLKHKEMIRIGFLLRVLYIPIFLGLLISSFFNIIFFILAICQLLGLFLIYFLFGLRKCKGKDTFFFPFIHTLKQLAQMSGIFVSFFRKP